MNAAGTEAHSLRVITLASCAQTSNHASARARKTRHAAGLMLTGGQAKLIRTAKPDLSGCQANAINNELRVSELTRFKVKALLTWAHSAGVLNTATRLNAELVVKMCWLRNER
ncbi:SsrA-binding protein [Candidatus Hodgkinia cicadicola]|nr:SsrA-binding protein [Candidatus Hodgkinia cicadicola]